MLFLRPQQQLRLTKDFYELQFNAKINLATTYEGSGNSVINILEKMLRDAKNIEYQDQIYHAIAKVYEKQGKFQMAIDNYKLSAKKSINNPKQKGKSFLALGDYYFNQPDYLKAYNYFLVQIVQVQTVKRDLRKEYFEKRGIYFAGRLAEYKYINTDQAIEIGISTANKILMNNRKNPNNSKK